MMGPLPFKPEDPDASAGGCTPAGDGSPGGAGTPDALGLTRVTLSRGGHVFEFRCERGEEAALARAVVEMSQREGSPLEPGDAFALCRRIESLATPGTNGPGADAASKARKAA